MTMLGVLLIFHPLPASCCKQGRAFSSRLPGYVGVYADFAGGFPLPRDQFIDFEKAMLSEISCSREIRIALEHPDQPHVTAPTISLQDLRRGNVDRRISKFWMH